VGVDVSYRDDKLYSEKFKQGLLKTYPVFMNHARHFEKKMQFVAFVLHCPFTVLLRDLHLHVLV
jgi:hypothetical protein